MPVELSSYTIAWLLYLLSTIGCLIIFWRMTRNTRFRRMRRVSRIVVAVTLLTPANIVTTGVWLAPAFLVTAYELALGDFDAAFIPLLLMGIAACCMVLIVMLESVLRRIFGMQVERS